MEDIRNKMQYVTLGRSGLKVSRFSYGNFGSWTNDDEGQSIANNLVKKAFEAGINFFDTAEVYASGVAETQLGIALKELNVPRSDLVITTKIFWGKFAHNTTAINNNGTSRKRLQEGLDRSLKNLQLDYVDVLFCHRYDYETPTIEVVQAMKELIASGKALYWATSTWPVERVIEAILLADKIGCPRPIAEQVQYSMLHRHEVEKDYVALFDDYGYGTTIWGALKDGFLTGKYNEGTPEGSRFDRMKGRWDRYTKKGGLFSEENKENTLNTLRGLGTIAEKIGCSQTQLALAWNLKLEDVSTCILGARNEKQLQENLEALHFVDKITPEIADEIEALLNNRPTQNLNYQTRTNLPDRR